MYDLRTAHVCVCGNVNFFGTAKPTHSKIQYGSSRASRPASATYVSTEYLVLFGWRRLVQHYPWNLENLSVTSIISPWHTYPVRVTVVTLCVCVYLSINYYSTMQLSAIKLLHCCMCSNNKNGDFPETATFELERLAIPLTKPPGPTDQLVLCMHIIQLQWLLCTALSLTTTGYEGAYRTMPHWCIRTQTTLEHTASALRWNFRRYLTGGVVWVKGLWQKEQRSLT